MEAETSKDDFNSKEFLAGIARHCWRSVVCSPHVHDNGNVGTGFYMDWTRLLTLMAIYIPLLIILSDRVGFERTSTWRQAIRDASIAYALGTIASALILAAMGVLHIDQSMHEVAGMIGVQAAPASIGAILGRSQLGGQSDDNGKSDTTTTTTP